MKVFAVYNMKGGVGKTTSAVNLAYLSAAGGARTLIWDLDPQGGTSYYLCVQPKVKGGVKSLIHGKVDFAAALRMTGYPNLDLLPADFSFRNLETVLDQERKPLQAFERVIRPLRDHYDHLFIDCPPGLSLAAESMLNVTDVLLVPLIPTTLSLRAYNRVVKFLVDNRHKRLKVVPFFSMVNPSKPIHRVVRESVQARHPIFLRSYIPESNVIEAMGVKRSPIFSFARHSPESAAFHAVWQEVQDRLARSVPPPPAPPAPAPAAKGKR